MQRKRKIKLKNGISTRNFILLKKQIWIIFFFHSDEKCLHFWVFVMFRHYYTFVGFYYNCYWLLISLLFFPVLAVLYFSFKFRSFHVCVVIFFVPWTSSLYVHFSHFAIFGFFPLCTLSNPLIRILYAIYNFFLIQFFSSFFSSLFLCSYFLLSFK